MSIKMQINKRLGASLGLILGLAIYLFISGRGCGSDVPALKAFKNKADYILIEKGERSLYFQSINGTWFINDEKYPADINAVTKFLDKIESLKLTDLISSQSFYERYGLEAKDAMSVTVKSKDKVLRKLSIGNTASTGRHSFVCIDDKTEIYQAGTVFDSEQEMNVKEYRDKNICKINSSDIVNVAVTYKGKTFSFDKSSKVAESGALEEKWACSEFAETALNYNKVNQFIVSIAGLRASDFIEPPVTPNAMRNIASVLVKSKDAEATLTFFTYETKTKSDEKTYGVKSSADVFQFVVDEWQAKKIFIENLSEFIEDANKE